MDFNSKLIAGLVEYIWSVEQILEGHLPFDCIEAVTRKFYFEQLTFRSLIVCVQIYTLIDNKKHLCKTYSKRALTCIWINNFKIIYTEYASFCTKILTYSEWYNKRLIYYLYGDELIDGPVLFSTMNIGNSKVLLEIIRYLYR